MQRKLRALRASLNKPERAAYLFIAPSLAFLILFTLIPLVFTIGISFTHMDIFLQDVTFNAFGHYGHLLDDDKFWNAMKNTLYFAGLQVPLQIAVALLAAVFVSRNTRFRKWMRSALFLPSVCSLTAIGIMWSFLLDPQTGLYTYDLTQLGLPRLEFLKDPDLAMPTIIAMSAWRGFGYTMIILMAAIQNIPDSYYEAAQLDGASGRRQFFNITIPMIVPALNFSLVTSLIAAFQVFDQIFVTTQGGPLDRTETLVMYIYDSGFRYAPYDLGYASTISVALFAIIMVVALSLNRYFQKIETSDAE